MRRANGANAKRNEVAAFVKFAEPEQSEKKLRGKGKVKKKVNGWEQWLGAHASLRAERKSAKKVSIEIQVELRQRLLRREARRSRQGCPRSQRKRSREKDVLAKGKRRIVGN